jgi:hypothetical protein
MPQIVNDMKFFFSLNFQPTLKKKCSIKSKKYADIAIGEYSFFLRNSDYHPYTLVFQPCPKASQGTPMLLSLIKYQSKKMENLPIGSDDQDLAKTIVSHAVQTSRRVPPYFAA